MRTETKYNNITLKATFAKGTVHTKCKKFTYTHFFLSFLEHTRNVMHFWMSIIYAYSNQTNEWNIALKSYGLQ